MRTTACALALFCVFRAALADTTVLYDDAGGLPGGQPWLSYCEDPLCIFDLPGSTETLDPAGVRLTTTSGAQAGYTSLFTPGFPELDRQAGFALTFELAIDDEFHDNPNRAGFSVIALASDLLGIELAFWENEIWAQSGADFLHAEGIAFATTGGERVYTLEIRAEGYRLSAGGELLLAGPLRDYTDRGLNYTLPSQVFFGDDTTRAGAEVVLGRIELTRGLPPLVARVPFPPAGAGLLLLALAVLGRRRLDPRPFRCRRSV